MGSRLSPSATATWRHRAQRFLKRDGLNRSESGERIKSDAFGQTEEFNHIDSAVAAFYARNPHLLLSQSMRELLLPQTMSLALSDQQFN